MTTSNKYFKTKTFPFYMSTVCYKFTITCYSIRQIDMFEYKSSIPFLNLTPLIENRGQLAPDGTDCPTTSINCCPPLFTI